MSSMENYTSLRSSIIIVILHARYLPWCSWAPYRLQCGNAPWFVCWFWCYISCLFLCLLVYIPLLLSPLPIYFWDGSYTVVTWRSRLMTRDATSHLLIILSPVSSVCDSPSKWGLHTCTYSLLIHDVIAFIVFYILWLYSVTFCYAQLFQ